MIGLHTFCMQVKCRSIGAFEISKHSLLASLIDHGMLISSRGPIHRISFTIRQKKYFSFQVSLVSIKIFDRYSFDNNE